MTDFPVSLDSGAEPRLLAGDEGSALSAWVGAAIAMVGMLVAACTMGTAAFLYHRHRNRTATREVQKLQVKSTDNGGKKPQAWPDPEVGGGAPDAGETVLDKASPVHAEPVVPEKLSASVRLELAETLRGILEDEISRGLKASGISDRLDRLEQQQREQQVLSGALLPPSTKRGPIEANEFGIPAPSDLDYTVKAQASAYSSPAPEWASTLKASEAKVLKRDAETLTDLSLRDVATLTEGDQSGPNLTRKDSDIFGSRKDLTLSASARQRRYEDPPEKGWNLQGLMVDEDRSLRMSLVTIQRNLQKRDKQTQELHRQLRQTEQDYHERKLEATHATKRLQDLLCDPSTASQAQALELQRSRKQVEELSRGLADSKQSEVQWQNLAKRLRANFMQSERVAQEGLNVFRKHPAGELFLAPPPVYLEDDMDDQDPRNRPWDIGNSHINPYANDSWPFEPNASAQRCAVEPNLDRIFEAREDGGDPYVMVKNQDAYWTDGGQGYIQEDGMESDSEEDGSNGSAGGADAERAGLMLRLPTAPPESPHDQEFQPPEPSDDPEPLPTDDIPDLGVLSSSRSF